jgi:dTDP-4-amino-4,6-dideoxygalactose transaminase
LLRNHGLADRDNVIELGYNSRLDTLQAVVGNWLLPQAIDISNKRIENATKLDEGLSKISQIRIPKRPKNMRVVYHLYIVYAQARDSLLSYCQSKGIEAKVHYPIPIYKQPALGPIINKLNFAQTDFQAKNIISFPCDQHLSGSQIDEIIQTVHDFYSNASNGS